MRLSEIMGRGYFQIRLSRHQYDLVDKYFQGASQHRYLWIEAKSEKDKEFHNSLYYMHLKALFDLIASGDFSHFWMNETLVKRNLHLPETWRLKLNLIPMTPMDADVHLYDPEMFEGMCADIRWGVGEESPWDVLVLHRVDSDANIVLFSGAA